MNSFDLMAMRYNEWSSRNLIELLLMQSVRNFVLWKIVDSAIFVGIAVLVTKIIDKKDKVLYSLISSILVLLFIYASYEALITCGFVSVSLNYIWPLFAILANIYLVKRYIIEKPIKSNFKRVIIYLISIILLLFGINNEQYCAMLLLAYLFLFIYLKYKKIPIPKVLYLNFVVIIISLINVLVCPGTTSRFYKEMAIRFPDYASATFFDKINIGVSHCLNRLISHCDVITLILMFLIGIYGYIKNKISIKTLICFIPFMFAFICCLLLQLNYVGVSNLLDSNIGPFGFYVISTQIAVFNLVFYLTVILSLLYGFYQLYKYNIKLGAITFVLFTISILSTIMFGFTPSTLSLDRMYILFYFINMIIDYILIFNLVKLIKNNS